MPDPDVDHVAHAGADADEKLSSMPTTAAPRAARSRSAMNTEDGRDSGFSTITPKELAARLTLTTGLHARVGRAVATDPDLDPLQLARWLDTITVSLGEFSPVSPVKKP